MSEALEKMVASAVRRFKTYPEYRDSGMEWLGNIPSGWELKRLKFTVTGCQNGMWGDEPQGDEEDIACIRVADFDRVKNRINNGSLTFRSIPITQRKDRILQKGDLLLEKSGGGEQQLVGAVVFYDLGIPAVCSNFIARMPTAPGYHPLFLCYLHAAIYGSRLNYRSIKQSTGIQNLDSYDYLCEKVALPPLSLQRTIADFLDRETAKIDALVAKKEQLVELLYEKRAALITRAVTKGLDTSVLLKDSGVEWLGKIPAHWNVVRSKHLFSLRNIKALASDRQLTASQEHGVIPQEEFMAREGRRVTQVITGADILKHVEPNDFVISMRSFQGGIEWSRYSGAISSAYVVLAPSSDVVHLYFSYLLKSKSYVQALQSTTNLVRDGQALRFENFSLVDLPSFSCSEQRAISTFLDCETARIDALLAKIREGIERLKEYRTVLISAAVTGKIDVCEAA